MAYPGALVAPALSPALPTPAQRKEPLAFHAGAQAPGVFVVDEAAAAVVRRAWEEGGELAGVVELPRHFPLMEVVSQFEIRANRGVPLAAVSVSSRLRQPPIIVDMDHLMVQMCSSRQEEPTHGSARQ